MSHDCVFNIRFFRFISFLFFSFIYIESILNQFTRTKLDLYIFNKTCKTRLTLCGPWPSILEGKESQIREHIDLLTRIHFTNSATHRWLLPSLFFSSIFFVRKI